MELTNPNRAVLYARVSTDEQAKGFSRMHQEDFLREFCKKSGFEVVEVFLEDESAKDFKGRPAYQRLKKFAFDRTNKVSHVLFTKWDRFARNIREALNELNDFKRKGIVVEAIDQWINFDVPEDQMLLAVYLASPEIENRRRASNTREGMRKALKLGNWCSKPPKGYKRDPGSKLMIPNQDAEYIRRAFELVGLGVESPDSIRLMLNKEGFKCSKNQFNLLLKNPLYKGQILVKAWNGEPETFYQGLHEPLVDEATFNKVLGQFRRRRKASAIPKKDSPEMVLRGHLECMQCGGQLTGAFSRGNGGTYPYYKCQGKCKESFRAERPNLLIQESLFALQPRPEVVKLYYRIMELKFAEADSMRASRIATMRKEIQKKEETMIRAQELLLDGSLDGPSYQEIRTRHHALITDLEAQVSDLEAIEGNFQKYLRTGVHIIANVGTFYEQSDSQTKKQILGSILSEKLVYDSGNYRTIPFTEAVRTISLSIKELETGPTKKPGISAELSYQAPQVGLEPTTYGLTVRRSNQLSY